MHPRAQRIALCLVVAAVAPYTALKILWLTGSTVGVESSAGAAELHSTRVVVGNVVTILLELMAVGLAIALVRPWGRRVPGWIVVALAGGATGLLAPILVGLPLGGALQLVGTGELHTDGMDHLSPWVFALTYGGFGLLAIGIAVLAWCYTLGRWGRVLSYPPPRPRGWAIAVGALSMVPFGMAMTCWGLFGPGASGPRGMDALSQRTVLAVTGLLALVGWVVPLVRRGALRPRTAWVLTWVGCTTAALQGPTQVLLAHQGDPGPAMILMALVTLTGSVAYGLAVVHERLAEISLETGLRRRAP
ncbi:hypothetical protein [Blastococcus sp. SYSU DS1021]